MPQLTNTVNTSWEEDDRRNLAQYAREFDKAKAGAAPPTLEDLLAFMDSDPQAWTEALHRVLYLARDRPDLISNSQITEEPGREWVHMPLVQALDLFFVRPVFVASTLWTATGRISGTHPLAPPAHKPGSTGRNPCSRTDAPPGSSPGQQRSGTSSPPPVSRSWPSAN